MIQLSCGHDFFGDAWGDITRLPMSERDTWPGEEALAEMREAWEQLRDEILASKEPYLRSRPAWAQLVFEEGLDPVEALGKVR